MIADICGFVPAKLFAWFEKLLSGKDIVDTAKDLLQVKRFVGLPPLYIAAGSSECYFTQQQHLALIAAQAGVKVTFRVCAGGMHATEYLGFTPFAPPESIEAFNNMVDWFRTQFARVEEADK